MQHILTQDIHKSYKSEGVYDTYGSIPPCFTLKFHINCIHHLRQQLPKESTLIVKDHGYLYR